jgi:ATP-dependent protease ClpP protease subunit
MQGDIFIVGQIGSGQNESGQFVRGVELVDVIAQFRAIPENQKEITLVIDSPGGYVDTGDAIYNYLESKKAEGYTITCIQRGTVGSIATKIFLAGNNRVVNSAEQFFIHNPLVQNVTGDANVMQAVANQLQISKEKLLAFYAEKTGNNKEALEPLMDAETSLTADQAVALGFATEVITTEKEFATINTHLMDFKKEIQALKDLAKVFRQKAEAMQVQLAGGQMISVESADGNLQGAATNAPDGEHALADGRTIVVAGGKITEVKDAAPAAEATKKPEEQYVSVAAFKEFTESVNEALKAIKEAKDASAAELVDIRNQIKGVHTPPKKRENANQKGAGAGEKLSHKELMALRAGGKIEEYKEEYFRAYGVEPQL